MFSALSRRVYLGLFGRRIVILGCTLGNSTVISGVYRPVLPCHRDPEFCRVNEGEKLILRHTLVILRKGEMCWFSQSARCSAFFIFPFPSRTPESRYSPRIL